MAEGRPKKKKEGKAEEMGCPRGEPPQHARIFEPPSSFVVSLVIRKKKKKRVCPANLPRIGSFSPSPRNESGKAEKEKRKKRNEYP